MRPSANRTRKNSGKAIQTKAAETKVLAIQATQSVSTQPREGSSRSVRVERPAAPRARARWDPSR